MTMTMTTIPCPSCDDGTLEEGPTPGCLCGGCTKTVACDLCRGRGTVDAERAGRWLGERLAAANADAPTVRQLRARCWDDLRDRYGNVAAEAREVFCVAFAGAIMESWTLRESI